MIKNYLKTALRDLKRHPLHSGINLLGLSLGIACCILLALFVGEEWTFDRFHENADRIHRVVTEQARPEGDRFRFARTPAPLGPAIQDGFPEVESAVRVYRSEVGIEKDENTLVEDGLFIDPHFLSVFSFPLVRGNPETALAGPDGVVLSQRAATRHFGRNDALGQTLTVSIDKEVREMQVTGVAETPPENTDFQFDLLLSYELSVHTWGMLAPYIQDSWDAPAAVTYLLLHDAEAAASLNDKLPVFVGQHYDADDRKATSLEVQRLADIHFATDVTRGLAATRSPVYSYVLGAIALLVLLLACINFATLSLGRSAERAREVGVRKAVGALTWQLRRQFWGEAVVTSMMALLLGGGIAALFLPTFNGLAQKNLSFHVFGDPFVPLALLALALVVGLLAGSYPAMVLSRFEPVSVLKGRFRVRAGRSLTRALTVVQFTFAAALVAGVLVMSAQLHYISTKHLGYNPEQVVVVKVGGGGQDTAPIFATVRDEFGAHPAVTSVSGMWGGVLGGAMVHLKREDGQSVEASIAPMSASFLETLEVALVGGRNFRDGEAGEDRKAVVVNEAFLRAMGWDEPLGRQLPFDDQEMFRRQFAGMEVVGVVADFHFRSLHHQIEPIAITPLESMFGGVSEVAVRIEPTDMHRTLETLEATWSRLARGAPFEYRFLDQDVEAEYRAEQRWLAIVRYASAFALLIACIGLFGLAALAASRRTKEVGIRKTLGASVASLLVLLAGDYARLVGIATVLATPLVYLGARRWLDGFAYQVGLSAWLFVAAASVTLLVALGAIGWQTFRTATADPVKALRYE